MPKSHRSYPWPASRLGRERDVMHSLHLESKRTGAPITAIIEMAVCAHLNRSLEQQPPPPIGFHTATAAPPTAA